MDFTRFSFKFALVVAAAAIWMAAAAVPAYAITPCCNIVNINSHTGIVTARVNATGQQFEFRLSNPAQLPALRAGQPVFGNLKTSQVSLDGRTIAGRITSIAAAPAGGSNALGHGSATAQPPVSGTSSPGGGLQSPGIGVGKRALAETKQIDPCSFATADVLQQLLQIGLHSYFPYAMQKGGEHIKLSDPQVEQVTCPNMAMRVRFKIEYRQTRGLVQFQESGTVELESPLVGEVRFQPSSAGNSVVTSANFVGAVAVLTDITITSLNLKNVPNWIDNTWIRDCLNGEHSNWGCHDQVRQMRFDVSKLLAMYLQAGNTL